MFTLSDIREIAVQIERNGETAYRRAAQQCRNPDIAHLLETLAEDEREHAAWFMQLEVHEPAELDERLHDLGRDLLKDMMAQKTFSLEQDRLVGGTGLLDVLNQSIEFESDTILFYEMLYSFLNNSDAMRQLEAIIHEERTHIDRLNEMIGKLNMCNKQSL